MKLKTFVFVAMLAIPSAASARSPRDPAPGEKSADKAADHTRTTTTDKHRDPNKTTNRGEKTAKLSKHEVQIVAHVHHVNTVEITLGKLAQQRGTAAVKRYGEQLLQDHRAADQALTAFARRRGLATIPADRPQTAVEREDLKRTRKDRAALAKLKGADFDRELLRQLIAGHDKELAKTDVAIATVTDAELKTLLETNKSMLQRHADTARELQTGTAQARVDAKR